MAGLILLTCVFEVESKSDANAFRHCYTSFSTAEWLGWFLFATIFHGYAAWRRLQMKKRFGIVEPDWKSIVLWLVCCPCALAQELRTSELHSVDHGVWPQAQGAFTAGVAGEGEAQPAWYLPPKQAASPSASFVSAPPPGAQGVSRHEALVAEALKPQDAGAYNPPTVL